MKGADAPAGLDDPMSSGLEAVPVDARPAEHQDARPAPPGPGRMSVKNWWRVLKRTAIGASAASFGVIAGGCAFYAMLALFPGLSVFVSAYGLFLDPQTAADQLAPLQPILPGDVFDLVAKRVHELVSAPPTALGWGILISTGLALWSASAGSKGLLTALNIAYYEDEKRGFLRFNAVALLFTVGGVVWLIVALTAVVAVPIILATLPVGPYAAILLPLTTWIFFAGVVLFALAVLYRFGPSRRQAKWRWITPGSGVAALLLLLSSAGFAIYVRNFGSYNVTYGSIGAIVVVLLWLYIGAYVVLVGARFNAELELETSGDTTVGRPKPPGTRGAFVADHVAS